MEFIDGGTLATRLRSGPLAPREAADIVALLARAVQHAHDKGIIHRDLKPANVLLSKGGGTAREEFDLHSPKIADFGVAKHLEGSGNGGAMTQSGAILGTPSYMAPEQARGKSRDVGPAVDVYALGAVLYECLTGKPPFKGHSTLETIRQVLSDEPEPLRRISSKVPRDLEVICLMCLRKDPTTRYLSAAALAEDLDRFLAGAPIAARGRSIHERTLGWVRRRRGILLAVVGAAVVVGVALAVLPNRSTPTPIPNAPVPTEGLPADLRLVPRNAFAFLTIRPADLWTNPALLNLLELWEGRLHPEGMQDVFAKYMERITSFQPSAIDRATYVMMDSKGTHEPLVILSTRERCSPERLETFLTERKQHRLEIIGERRIYLPTGSKHDLAYYLAGDHILILGEPDDVKALANNSDPSDGPFTPALEHAAKTHGLVASVHPSAELVGELLAKNFDRDADALVAVQTLNLIVDVGLPEGPDQRVPVTLEAWATFPDAARAAAARLQVPKVVRKVLTEGLEKNRLLPPDLLDPIVGPLKSAEWVQSKDTLRANARTVIPVVPVKSHLVQGKLVEQSQIKLQRIAQALREYERVNGRLPPAVVTDADGKPLYSWRVLVLPYLGSDALYRRFHLNRAWDHPSNKPLIELMPNAYATPQQTARGTMTPYQVPVGTGGLFDSANGRRTSEATDGIGQTLLVVEAAEPVHWSQPADVTFSEATLPKLGSISPTGFLVAFADGTTRFFRHETMTPTSLRGLFTRAGGERK